MSAPIAVRTHGVWVLAHPSDNGFTVRRTRGVAFGKTPEEAAAWAFADGGRPAETFKTKREIEQVQS